MKTYQENIMHQADVCIIGGGFAGTFAAINAARSGVKVVLMQDRPVLGGNASSEIRLYPRGTVIPEDRETGLMNEMEEENIYRNKEINNCIWDSVLLGRVLEEKNIELLTNCTCLGAERVGDKITEIKGWQLTTYQYHTVKAKIFIDCSGDAVLAPLIDAEFMFGSEDKSVFGEDLAPDVGADRELMSMSCLIQTREVDHKVDFVAPDWANYYPDAESLGIPEVKLRHTRDATVGIGGCNLWWMSVGGDGDTIADTEKNRNELLKIAFGVWDYIKNRSGQKLDNWDLEWIGFLPGKRESRRYVGEYILKQQDVIGATEFFDTVAYGGWPLDIHDHRGMHTNDYHAKFYPVEKAYGIPFRSLISKDVKNLMFAGRNLSASRVAMGSTRVMATCGLLGEAVGFGAALCIKYDKSPIEICNEHIKELQDMLLEKGLMLPGKVREIPELSLSAKLNVSDADRQTLFNGVERPRPKCDKVNYIELPLGEDLTFTFDSEKQVNELRIVYDLDYTRESITKYKKIKLFTLRAHMPMGYEPIKVANTIVKDFEVYVDGKLFKKYDNNYYSFVKLPIGLKAKEIKIKFNKTWGYDKARLYSVDVK